MKTIQKSGKDLKKGDTLELWWGRDTITSFENFGAFSKDFINRTFPEGAVIAKFARNQLGMTIDFGSSYSVIVPE